MVLTLKLILVEINIVNYQPSNWIHLTNIAYYLQNYNKYFAVHMFHLILNTFLKRKAEFKFKIMWGFIIIYLT